MSFTFNGAETKKIYIAFGEKESVCLAVNHPPPCAFHLQSLANSHFRGGKYAHDGGVPYQVFRKAWFQYNERHLRGKFLVF